MKTLRKIYDKKVFLTAFFATILIHGEIIFNKISFHDDLDTVFDGWTNSIRHGRWMYRLLSLIPEKLAGMESVPVVIGIIVAACIGLMACLLFEIFQIKEYIVQFSLILIFCSLPAVAGEFGYMGYAGYDFIGKLLCVASAYLICEGINGKKNLLSFIAAIIVLACSIGEYQCNITLFLTIMLIHFIQGILNNQLDWKGFWLTAVYYVGAAIAGLLLYLGILQVVLRLAGTELTSYAGMDSYGIVSISEYIERILYAYVDFRNSRVLTEYSMFPFEWKYWKWLILLAMMGLSGAVAITVFLRKEYKKIVQFIIALVLVPFALNFNFVLYGVESVHSLHMYQYVLLYIFFVVLAKSILELFPKNIGEKIIVKNILKLIQGITVVVILIFGAAYIRYDNMCYMQLEMRQEAAIRYFSTLITKIESTEGYKMEYPVVYINDTNKRNIADSIYTEYDRPVTNPFNMEIVNSYNWDRFMLYWCGFDPEEWNSEDYENHPDVVHMPCYPDDGSIKVINNVVVVKF